MDGHVGVPAGAGGGDINPESDGDGSKQTPGTPPDAVTPEVTTSSQPVQSLAAELATAAQLDGEQPPAQSLAAELAATAQLGGEQAATEQPTQLIESWAEESQDLKETEVGQSSFEKSKFRSPGGTIPIEPPEDDESLHIFKDVIGKALTSPTQGTPKRDAFKVLMSSTPLQRTTSGIPMPSRSRSMKREPNRTPEGESNSRPRLQSDA